MITLRLDPQADADLIDLLSRAPPRGRAALVRAALRGADLHAYLPPAEEEAIEAALDRLGEAFEI
ncbi:MAG: hypothetical protein QN194_16415 [Armatimonadota bacterium]|nr:hypothetical protein [Armatimonadota bacterium]